MKEIFPALTVLFFSFFYSQAQVCTPVWVDTGYGINPDTTINLPHANAGSPYDAVVQFKTPPSTLFNGLPVTIDHIVLTDVSGLSAIPASVPFYFQCNPSDCSFEADSVRCVRIQGTPTTPGTYPLTIEANVYFSPLFFLPVPTTGYRIVVDNAIGIQDISKEGFDISQNEPNPVINLTDIYVNLPAANNFSIEISNLLAENIFNRSVHGQKGLNTVVIDATSFAPGIYFYTISDATHSITKRMLVKGN